MEEAFRADKYRTEKGPLITLRFYLTLVNYSNFLVSNSLMSLFYDYKLTLIANVIGQVGTEIV